MTTKGGPIFSAQTYIKQASRAESANVLHPRDELSPNLNYSVRQQSGRGGAEGRAFCCCLLGVGVGADHPGAELAASAGLLRNHRHSVRQPQAIFLLDINFTVRPARRSLPLRAPLGTRDILLSHAACNPSQGNTSHSAKQASRLRNEERKVKRVRSTSLLLPAN